MNQKYIRLIVLSVLLSLAGFWFLFIQFDDFPLEKIHFSWLVPAILSILLFWLGDTFCLSLLLKGLNVYARYYTLLKSSLIGFFISAVTPFSIGNIPAQIVYLEKQGIRLEKSVPALMMKSIINLFIRGSLAIFLLLAFPSFFAVNSFWIIRSILFFYGSSIIVIYLLVFNQSKIILHYRIAFAHQCLKLGKRFSKIHDPLTKIGESIKQMHYSIQAYSRRWFCIVISAFILLSAFVVQSTIPYTLIRTLGGNSPLLSSSLIHASYYLLQPFLPTPGGSGLAEMSFNIISRQLIGTSSLWLVLLWRLLTFFLPMFAGLAFTVFSLSEKSSS